MNTPLFSKPGAGSATAVILTIALLSGCAGAPTVTPAARSELAPTGKLRVGLLVVSPSSVSKDGTPVEMQGVGVEIGRELAKRLNVAFEPVRYRGVASLLDGARNREWDVAPIGYSSERTADMDFTALYIVGGSTYLVPAGSPIRNVADVDKPGNRIAAPARSMPEAYLTANLKRAEVVRSKTMTEALDLLESGKLHAFSPARTLSAVGSRKDRKSAGLKAGLSSEEARWPSQKGGPPVRHMRKSSSSTPRRAD